MTEEEAMPLYDLVGYDYQQAIRDLLEKMTYEELAFRVGYKSAGSIHDVLKRGRIPAHPHGQAIWVVYRETFQRKPPMTEAQRVGIPDLTYAKTLAKE